MCGLFGLDFGGFVLTFLGSRDRDTVRDLIFAFILVNFLWFISTLTAYQAGKYEGQEQCSGPAADGSNHE